MNPQTQKAVRFLQSWIINTAAVLVAAAPGPVVADPVVVTAVVAVAVRRRY